MQPRRQRIPLAPASLSAHPSPRGVTTRELPRRPSASPQPSSDLRLVLPPLPRSHGSPILSPNKIPGSSSRRRLMSQAIPEKSPNAFFPSSFTLQVPTAKTASRLSPRRESDSDQYPNRVRNFACLSKEGKVRSQPKVHNQDAYLVVERFAGRPDASLFGVFDGHGSYGHDVSKYLKEHLEDCITRSLKPADMGNPELVIDALKEGFKWVNAGIRKGTVDSIHSGSTCVVVVIIGDVCICGNVGDSRAVLVRNSSSGWFPVPLSEDHKPSVEDERARIIERGGVIAQQCSSSGLFSGPLRVWLPGQQAPGLAMTRSMGDTIASKIGVVGEPELRQVMLTEQDQVLVLASDGLWEVLSNEEVVAILKRYDSSAADQAAERLMEEAQRRWDGSTVDDTTIVLVWLECSTQVR